MTEHQGDGTGGVRLDKWLWAARFFKTRQLAVAAINGGRVQANGQRAKPGKTVQPGTRLTIHKGSLEWELEIKAVSRQRRPAKEAALLYEESEASRLRRQELVRARRESGQTGNRARGRPGKRDRRMIHRFTRRTDG
jgi:ribosome-associated heat shock protein Hsp15